MSYMFFNCKSLKSLPDISDLNTSYVADMSYIFSNCESLLCLPDISKWDLTETININHMFSNCKSLSSLPDISKWNINKVFDISYIFNGCESITCIPDISKWNLNKSILIRNMFSNCKSLISLPNISKWDLNDTVVIDYFFSNCISLLSLPDISKWKKYKFYMIHTFDNCLSILNLFDIKPENNNNGIINNISLGEIIKNKNLNFLKLIDYKNYLLKKENKIKGILEIKIDVIKNIVIKDYKNLVVFLNNKKINCNNFNVCYFSNEVQNYLFEFVFYEPKNKLNFYIEKSQIISIDLS